MYGPSALDAALQPRLNFKAALNKPAETAGAATADNLQAALDKSKATTHLENIARDIKGVRSAR